MVLYEIIYLLICIAFAGLNAAWIQDGKKIKHGWNGLLHITVAAVAWWIYAWPVFIIILCNTNVVFNISLALFRGKHPFYVSPKPVSIIDKIEKMWFGNNGLKPKAMYLAISAVLHWVYFYFYH